MTMPLNLNHQAAGAPAVFTGLFRGYMSGKRQDIAGRTKEDCRLPYGDENKQRRNVYQFGAVPAPS